MQISLNSFSGIYFTSYPEYAAKYCEPDSQDQIYLLLSYLAMVKPYPIIDVDEMKFMGKGSFEKFGSHYVPVSPIPEDSNNTMIFKPPQKGKCLTTCF